MTSATVKAKKNFFPSKDRAQPDHFLLHKEELVSYPVLFLLLHLSFSAGLEHNTEVLFVVI
jgi:hypothetical protein